MATTTVAPRTAAYPRSRVYEWLTTTDHKKIGVLYITTAFAFFILGGILAQLRAAVQVLREKPKAGLAVFVLSLFIHVMNLTYFYQITSTLLGHAPPVPAVSVIFPIGLLTMVLPVSVAGVGVGHMAFDQLFSAVGLSGGANAFHAFIVGNVGPMLLGAIPYLVLRRSRPSDAAAPAD